MSSAYTAPDRRTRTLLQSFDTARFHDHERADRLTDINQARSEILSAVLLGHEVVLPAGLIADSPAAMVLLPEILPGYFAQKEAIRARAGRRYDPFRIGVEQRFTSTQTPAYDAFVHDYVASSERRLGRWRNFEDLVGPADALAALVEAGKNYLRRDWKAIRDLLGPYADYASLVAEVYSRGDADNAEPVVCPDGRLSAPGVNSIERKMKSYVRMVERRGLTGDELVELSRGIALTFERITAEGGKPGERGAWYAHAEDFGEQWRYARIWLDQILAERLIRAFAIDLQSLFAQELEDNARDRQIGLAYVSARAFERFENEAPDARPPLPPALANIAWEKIWEFVAQEDVQQEQSRLQARLASARTAVKSDLMLLARARPEGWEKKAELRRGNFAAEVGDALDEYLAFLKSGERTLLLKRRGSHLLAEVGKTPKSLKGTKTGKGISFGTALTIGVTVDASTGSPGLGTAGMVGLTALETVTGPVISDRLIAVIDRLRRPRNRDVGKEGDFYRAAREQVNYWVMP